MDPLNLIAAFAAGFFVCFAIPHLCSGLQGIPFRNLLGKSTPLINFIIGTLSLFLGLLLLAERRFYFDINICSLLFWVAFILTGFLLASRRQT